MHVVFVIPPFNYARSVGNARRRARNGILPPLGVGFLASALAARGHTSALVDAMAEQFDAAETVEAVLAAKPDLVGLSIMTTFARKAACSVVDGLREKRPDLPLVLGGPHILAAGSGALKDVAADYAIPGEGEIPLSDLADCIASGGSVSGIAGLYYRDSSGAVVETAARPHERDLDVFAAPDRRLYKPGLYQPLPSLNLGRHVTTVITSRGCPWARCAFCHQGSGCSVPFRRRSPEHVADEVEALVRDWGVRSVIFWDDNFCVMPRWVDRFCGILEARNLHISWSVLARADTVTSDMLRRMAKAGCYSIQFGFESGSQEILDMIRKGTTLEQYRRAVCWSRAAGLEVRGSFMLGFPGETPEMSLRTIEFACELNADYTLFFAYHVLPGTALEERALREGEISGPELSIHMPTYVPYTYPDIGALADMVRLAYRRYYLRPAYAVQALRRLARKPSLARNYLVGLVYWAGLALRP